MLTSYVFRVLKQNSDEMYLTKNYNVNLDTMADEEKISFLDSENEKLLSKVLDLTFSLRAVLVKVQEKTVAKPKQAFMHLGDDYKGII
jgi:hypothetical protein